MTGPGAGEDGEVQGRLGWGQWELAFIEHFPCVSLCLINTLPSVLLKIVKLREGEPVAPGHTARRHQRSQACLTSEQVFST